MINRAQRQVELLQDTFDAWWVCRGERWSCSGLISTCAKPRRMVFNLKLGGLRALSASHMHENIDNAPFGAHPPWFLAGKSRPLAAATSSHRTNKPSRRKWRRWQCSSLAVQLCL